MYRDPITGKDFNPAIVFIGGFLPSIARLAEYNYEVVKMLAKRLAKYGIKIIVLANRPDIFISKDVKPPTNVKVIRAWYRATTLLLPLKLIQVRKTGDILVLSLYHGIFDKSGIVNFLATLLVLVVAKVLRYKTITILHTLPELREKSFIYFTKTFSYIYCLGARITTLLIFNLSHKVLLLVKTYRDVLCDASPNLCSKVSHIPHGVPNYVHYDYKKLSHKDVLTIAFIGLISPRKNFIALIKALSKVRLLLNSKIKLILIGAPHPYLFREALSLIRQTVNDHIDVKYLGYLETSTLQEYVYRYVDIIVLPYDNPTGTSGIAHIVAPAATPIIMPSFIEYTELYREGHGLKLYNAYSKDLSTELAKAILGVLTNPIEYEKLSRRALSYAKTHDVARTSLMLLKEIVDLWRK